MAAPFGRLITAMVTPFNDEARWTTPRRAPGPALIASGSDGLVVSGTTGESPTLTAEEKLRLYAEVKSAVGGRPRSSPAPPTTTPPRASS